MIRSVWDWLVHGGWRLWAALLQTVGGLVLAALAESRFEAVIAAVIVGAAQWNIAIPMMVAVHRDWGTKFKMLGAQAAQIGGELRGIRRDLAEK